MDVPRFFGVPPPIAIAAAGSSEVSCLACAEDAPAAPRGLTDRLQSLDREAWKSLYVEQSRLVRGVLCAYVGYGADLDDLAQQVFVTASTLVRTERVVLRGDASGVRAWLAAIAVRVGRDARRRRAIADKHVQAGDVDAAAPAQSLEAHEVLVRLERALNGLPQALREVWCLRHLEHMTIPEMASAFSCSMATVKRRLAKADRRIAQSAAADPVLCEYIADGGEP